MAADPREVGAVELAGGGLVDQVGDPRLRRQDGRLEHLPQRLAQPGVDRHLEAPLRTVDHRGRQPVPEGLLEHPLGRAAADLPLRGDAGGQLEQLVVEQQRPRFQAVGHAGAVDLDQHVAGQAQLDVDVLGARDRVLRPRACRVQPHGVLGRVAVERRQRVARQQAPAQRQPAQFAQKKKEL